jgi:hypothetical protein
MFDRAQRRADRALTPPQVGPWNRRRLIAVFAAAVTGCALVLLGLGLAVYYTLQPDWHPASAPQGDAGGGSGETGAESRSPAGPAGHRLTEDALANRGMPTVSVDAAQPGPVSARDPGQIVVPAATRTGPAGVPTGFPHTPQGALGQLAAIDQTAMQSGNLDGVRAVIADWAAPGGPTPTGWSAVAAMTDFLNSAGLSGGGGSQLSLVVTPLMGLIKGTVGSDFVLPCVDFQFDVTLQTTVHVAAADCQRMVWRDDRWVVGPGPEPANPPSVWADTDIAITVGYKDLRHA